MTDVDPRPPHARALVYSSSQSLVAAIEQRRGVYHSRTSFFR